MRPHRLELTAFGSFPGTETVDFDALAESGLFLLHGETGAGKTTVLDALCFALYGCVPGARHAAKRLRSDHAAAEVATEVELELTAGGQRLRVVRSPEQDLPKRRGTGLTRRRATVTLQRWVGQAWEPVSSRPDEVGAVIADAVGMTADQFCQVVLLPQGEFARFLRAGDREREELLDRLFGADLYRRVEQSLDRRRGEAQAALLDAESRLHTLDARLHEIAVASRRLHSTDARTRDDAGRTDDSRATDDTVATDAVTTDAVTTDDALTTDAVTTDDLRTGDDAADPGRLRSELAAHLARATARAAAAAEAAETTRAALAEAEALTERLRRRAALEQARDQLMDRQAWREATARRVAAARRAAVVLPLAEQSQLAAQALAAAEDRLLASGLTLATTDVDDLVRTERAAHELVTRLESMLPVEAALGELTAKCSAAEERLAEVSALLAAMDEQRPVAATQLRELEAALAADRLAAAALPSARATLETARAAATAASQLVTARDQLQHRAAEQVRLDAAANDAHASLLRLVEARLLGMAAELATGLVPGEPCAVCGSADHPAPATGTGPVVGVGEQQAAQHALETARAAAEEHRAALLAAEVRVAELESAVATSLPGLESPTADQLQVLVGRLEAEVAEAAAAEAAVADRVEQHGALSRLLQEAGEQATALREEHAVLTTTLEHLRADRSTKQAVLGAALGRDTTVEAALAEARLDLTALRDTIDAARAAEAAAARHRSALEAAVAAASEAGFDDVAQAVGAALEPAALADLEASLRSYDDELAHAVRELASPELAAVATAAAPALDDLRAAAAAADSECALVAGDLRVVTELQRRLDELAVQAEAQLAEISPRRAAYERLAGLADAVSGKNGRSQRLSAYVLAARLEQVAEAASERLVRMSGGRYTLAHTDEAADLRKRAGLGLTVVDLWHGRDRDVATLSGGETFMASLALALGLADVVRSESGGTDIDALFIDEGFGSLDARALDEVMDVLDGLREGGRLVGLVSHVAELRQRITATVEVVKGSAGAPGSTLRQSAEPTARAS